MAPLPQHGSVINQCVVVENQTLWPLHEVGDRAKALVVEFLEANKQAIWSVRWLSPPENCYKANFDTTMFKSLGYAGIELVVQNHLGGGRGGKRWVRELLFLKQWHWQRHGLLIERSL